MTPKAKKPVKRAKKKEVKPVKGWGLLTDGELKSVRLSNPSKGHRNVMAAMGVRYAPVLITILD